MDQKGAELIISSLRDYSAEASKALEYLQKYDYRGEAAKWETMKQPALLEVEHPTIYDLYIRLVRFIRPVPHLKEKLPREALLYKDNFDTFSNYINVSQETLLAARFNRIPIEPMLGVAEAFQNLSLTSEAGLLRRVYEFAYSVRKWYQTSKRNPGTPIVLKLEINYDEASPADLATDEGYRTFASLFKPSCNYSTKQKRALYNELKALYTTEDPKVADRIVMAVILIFRKPKTRHHQPFGTKNITGCKEKAMAAFGRDCKVIQSYSENSLTDNPKLADAHVKRAESIIDKALESFR